jgi:hypothetical protein
MHCYRPGIDYDLHFPYRLAPGGLTRCDLLFDAFSSLGIPFHRHGNRDDQVPD